MRADLSKGNDTPVCCPPNGAHPAEAARPAGLVMSGGRSRGGRLGSGLLPAAAALNQQSQKQNDVNGEDGEENVAEPFAAILFRVALQDPRSLKWIECFHDLSFPANSVPAPLRGPRQIIEAADLSVNPPTRSARAPSFLPRNPPATPRA